MKLSRTLTFALLPALAIALLGIRSAAALDAPHTFHRSHTAEPHLTDSRRHHAAAPAAHAVSHTAPHASSHAAAPPAKATATRASRRHAASAAAACNNKTRTVEKLLWRECI